MKYSETMPEKKDALSLGSMLNFSDGLRSMHGRFRIEVLEGEEFVTVLEKDNIITKDAGLLVARLLKDSQTPTPGIHNGPTMLAVGSGATGSLLAPDSPQREQRALNTEIARKTFSDVSFRDTNGNVVAYPTNILSFTTTFLAAEAVGPWNEMGLVAPYSQNPLVTNPILNGPSNYDPTVDTSNKDLVLNYLTFPVISKLNGSVTRVTWWLTI